MKYLKLFENFDKIGDICQKYNIRDYTITTDGIVNVDNDVYLQSRALSQFPLKLGKINGSFDCSDNCLITLIGGPNEVKGDYCCDQNKLLDVYGFPKYFYGRVGIEENPVYEVIESMLENPSVSYGERYYECINKIIKWLNEYNAIKGNMIFEEGLKQVYFMIYKSDPVFDDLKFKNYQLI